ncbi:hypothetical protein TWF730_002613 [Orbilia blumenaviensis]|uniref:Uncharacterized protein n=1 Tax=Orbilia blumenaviensis TaxID=1796055 RepID=A0AAV9UAI5_9PEZI
MHDQVHPSIEEIIRIRCDTAQQIHNTLAARLHANRHVNYGDFWDQEFQNLLTMNWNEQAEEIKANIYGYTAACSYCRCVETDDGVVELVEGLRTTWLDFEWFRCDENILRACTNILGCICIAMLGEPRPKTTSVALPGSGLYRARKGWKGKPVNGALLDKIWDRYVREHPDQYDMNIDYEDAGYNTLGGLEDVKGVGDRQLARGTKEPYYLEGRTRDDRWDSLNMLGEVFNGGSSSILKRDDGVINTKPRCGGSDLENTVSERQSS